MRRVLRVAVVASLLIGTAAPAQAKAKLRLSSPAFKPRETIPDGFTCDGANASPPLRWKGVPKQTVELAVTMQDPDARVGTFTHWVIWGIDPGDKKLPEETLPSEIVEGQHYFGPCPPAGDEPHRYVIRLYALSEPVDLDAGAPIEQLLTAIDGTVLAKAKLIGLYSRSTEESA